MSLPLIYNQVKEHFASNTKVNNATFKLNHRSSAFSEPQEDILDDPEITQSHPLSESRIKKLVQTKLYKYIKQELELKADKYMFKTAYNTKKS